MILLSVVSDARDVDSKEKIADLETKIVELGKQNAGLKNKVPIMIFLFTVSEDFPELADQNVILDSKQL